MLQAYACTQSLAKKKKKKFFFFWGGVHCFIFCLTLHAATEDRAEVHNGIRFVYDWWVNASDEVSLKCRSVPDLSNNNATLPIMDSFLMDLPGNTAFIIVFIVLASVQGLGIGIYMTAVYTSITYLFPNTTGTAKVT